MNTTYASLDMLAHEAFGTEIRSDCNHNSANAVAAGSQLVARASILVQMACWAVVGWRCRRAGRPYSMRLAAAALPGFLIGGKVLSPQSLIRLIPFFAVAGPGRVVFLVCCLLTTATYL